jgi:hypothetical protein
METSTHAARSGPATLPAILSTVIASISVCLAGIGGVAADPMPDTENGRYTLAPVTGGVIRLDTRTGEVSNCNASGAGWACYAVPDERKAMDREIGRLQAENDRLKAQLASRDAAANGKTDEALPKSDKEATPKSGERRIEIPMPSDQDIDRMMSFLERTWRRLVDMASRIQKDASGRI